MVMDLYGGQLADAGYAAPLAPLIRLLEEFGIEPPTSRVTLSRMKRDGWFTTERAGRETVYRLTDHYAGVLAAGRARIFHRPAEPWDGVWTQLVYQVPESARAAREGLRKQLLWLGFGQFAPSIWFSPHAPDDGVERLREEFPDATVDLLRSTVDDDRALAARCWDLAELAEDYRALLDHCARVAAAPPASGAQALVASTTLTAEARRLVFRDPFLPAELQPEGWPGDEAFARFLALHQELEPAAAEHVRAVTLWRRPA